MGLKMNFAKMRNGVGMESYRKNKQSKEAPVGSKQNARAIPTEEKEIKVGEILPTGNSAYI